MAIFREFLYSFTGKIADTKAQFCIPPLTPPSRIAAREDGIRSKTAKFVVLVLLLLGCGKVVASDSLKVELPDKEILFESLGEYYKEATITEIETFTYVEKWKWLQFAPSFGWNFVQNTPYIGWSSSDLFNAINAKRAKKAKILGIIRTANLNYDTKCKQIALKTHVFEAKKRVFDTKTGLLTLKEQFYGIFKDKYDRKELEPSIYIQKSIDFENFKLEIEQLRYELVKIKIDILQTAYFGEVNTLFDLSDPNLDY